MSIIELLSGTAAEGDDKGEKKASKKPAKKEEAAASAGSFDYSLYSTT